MGFINYQGVRKLLVITKGHPFDQNAFHALLDSVFPDDQVSVVEQPAAEALIAKGIASSYDAIIHYDMPGMMFSAEHRVQCVGPSEAFKSAYLELLAGGKGLVFLHHSLASWPGWPEFSEIIGGRFLYQAGEVRGRHCPDSGYRHEVEHQLRVHEAHPVTEGLGANFTLTDELYLGEVFEDSIHPLLVSGYSFVQENFYSASEAVKGRLYSREGWTHEPGSSVIGWYKNYLNSPIVYLQCGDDDKTYSNSSFQTLLSNAVNWVSSDEAGRWALAQ